MKRFPDLIAFCFVFAVMIAALRAHATTYVVVSPDPAQMPEADRLNALSIVNRFLVETQFEDRVLVYDGANARRLAAFEIGRGSVQSRTQRMQGEVAALVRHFRVHDPETPDLTIDLPRMCRQVLRPLAAEDDLRVLVLGNPFDAVGGNAAASFNPGEYPNDAYLTDAGTAWSIEGRSDYLQKTRVSWVSIGEVGQDNETKAAMVFLCKYIAGQGGVLVQDNSEGAFQHCVDALMTGKDTPLYDEPIDHGVTRPLITPIQAVAPAVDDGELLLSQARSRVGQVSRDYIDFLKARDLLQTQEPVTILCLVDASASWADFRPDVLASIERGAAATSLLVPWCRVQVIPFRMQTLDGYPLTTIRPDLLDRGASQQGLTAYLESIESQSDSVDIEGATAAALADLSRRHFEGRVCVMLLTDTTLKEKHDRPEAAYRRLSNSIQAWLGQDQQHSFLACYVGDQPRSEAADFMRQLSTDAGDQASYVGSRGDVITALLEAALHE